MQKTFMSTLLLIISFVTIGLITTACDSNNQLTVDPKDLIHHRFELISVNNEAFSQNNQVFIEFNENMNINGKMCNVFFGQATLNTTILKSPGVSMTKMQCGDNEQLNQLDKMISLLLKNGATLSLDSETGILILKNDQDKLKYILRDLM